MERPIFKPVGTPVDELDTPALVVDLAILESNIEAMASFFRGVGPRLRPHVEAHRCTAIAHKQLAAGGTVGGVCVNTVGQAEVFATSGFPDIFVANVVVTPQKINLLCALARHARMAVAVDSLKNIRDLSEAAAASGTSLDVLVYINTGLNGCGVEPGRPAVALAGGVRGAERLRFAGLTTYEGALLDEDEEAAGEARRRLQQVLDTREMAEKAGMEVGVVSVGGTHDYDIAASMSGVTEVVAGSYALMDERYRRHRREFEPAARVLGTVTSVPDAGTAIADAGRKAIGGDTGPPALEGLPGVEVRSLSAEHGNLKVTDSFEGSLEIGDQLWFTPYDVGECANLYDYIHGVRNGVLEVVWEVPARGRYR